MRPFLDRMYSRIDAKNLKFRHYRLRLVPPVCADAAKSNGCVYAFQFVNHAFDDLEAF